MSRTLSPAAVAALTRQYSGEAWLPLLTISDPGITTIRAVGNTVPIVSRGNTYAAAPFKLFLPTDVDGELQPGRIEFGNADRMLIDEIRGLANPISVVAEIITASTPNTVEIGPLDFKLTFADWSDEVVTGSLEFQSGLRAQFPKLRFDPQTFPQVFGVLDAPA